MTVDDVNLESGIYTSEEEGIPKYLELIQEHESNQNWPEMIEASFLLGEHYEKINHFEEAISLYQKIISMEITEDDKLILQLTDKWIANLLKTEDFHALEKVLVYRERYLNQNKQQKLMQQFYYAVCYEGLRQNEQAIACLTGIPDTMSNNNLISKYLKLAMLYLKENQLPLAISSYEHALVFDKSKRNPMFYLVLSDLLYTQGKYEEALGYYQDYFLKDKVKNRYLDRYIYINMALGKWDEAWRFYQEFEPKMEKTISKNYRRQFYESAEKLAISLKRYEALNDIKEKLDRLNEVQTVIVDWFDGVRQLFQTVSSKQYTKKRDIVLDIYRKLSEMIELPRLQYIAKEEDGYQIYHFRKGLLLEKQVTYQEIQATFLETIYHNNADYQLYSKTDLNELRDITKQGLDSYEYMVVSKVKIGNNEDYVIAFLNQTIHFDYFHKLLLFCANIIQEKMNATHALDEVRQISRILQSFCTNQKIALLSIEHEVVEFHNELSNTYFGIHEKTVPYQTIQELFALESKVYVDQFITNQDQVIPLKQGEFPPVSFRFRSMIDGTKITLFVTNEGDNQKSQDVWNQQVLQEPIFEIPSFFQLTQDVLHLTDASTIIYIHIPNEAKLNHHFGLSYLKSLSHQMLDLFFELGKHYFINVYRSFTSGWFLLLKTIDKRVITRILTEFNHQIQSSSILEVSFEIHYFVYTIQRKNPSLELFQELVELAYQTNQTPGILFYDKTIASRQHLLKTIHLNMSNYLQKGRIPLSFYPFGNWQTKTILGYMVNISQDLLLGEEKDMFEAKRRFLCEKKWDQLLFDSLLQILTHSQINQGIYCFEFSEASSNDRDFLYQLIKKWKKKKYPFSKLGFLLTNPNSETIQYLREKTKEEPMILGVTGLQSLTNHLNISTIDYLFVSIEEKQLEFYDVEKIEKQYPVRFVLDHHHQTIKKSQLEKNHIHLLKGDYFPMVANIDDLHHLHETVTEE